MKKAILHLDVLVSALERTKKVKISSPVAPIVTSWFVAFSKKEATVWATDLEVSMSVDLPCECPEPFDCLIHPNALALLKKMDNQPLVVEYNETNQEVTFVADGDRGKFQNDEPSNFPEMHRKGKEIIAMFSTDSKVFTELEVLRPFMSDDPLRERLRGVNFAFPKNELEMCATDGAILATSTTDYLVAKHCTDFILRSKAVKLLSNYMPKVKEEPVQVDFDLIDNKWVSVSFGDTAIVSKLVDEKFVDFKSVIPEQSTVQFSGDKTDFIKKVDKAMTCANVSTKQVRLHFNGSGGARISSEDFDLSSEYSADLKGNCVGGPFKIAFHGNFIKTVVSQVRGDNFVLQMTAANKPGVVRDGKRLMLSMPQMIGPY